MPRKRKKIPGVTELATRWKVRFVNANRSPREKAYYFDKGAFSPKEIEDLRNQLYKAKELGWDPWTGLLPWESAEPDDEAPTLSEAVEAYGEHKLALGHKGLEGGWAETTHHTYMTDLRAFVRLATLGDPDRRLAELKAEDLEA